MNLPLTMGPIWILCNSSHHFYFLPSTTQFHLVDLLWMTLTELETSVQLPIIFPYKSTSPATILVVVIPFFHEVSITCSSSKQRKKEKKPKQKQGYHLLCLIILRAFFLEPECFGSEFQFYLTM